MLRVLSIGHRVPRASQIAENFEVHSQFQHALNLRSATGELISLLDQRYGNFPTAIRMIVPPLWDWRNIPSEQPVCLVNGVLDGGSWLANLRGAPCWQPEAAVPLTGAAAALEVCHEVLAIALIAHVQREATTSALQLLPGWPAGAREVRLTWKSGCEVLETQVLRCIGYGGGLTPDGDDYLLGYIAALWPWRHDVEVATHVGLLTQSIGAYLHRTTDISRHYLGLALEGHVSESVNRLMVAIASAAAPGDVQDAGKDVMRFGAASGVDCLAGFLHGLRALASVLGNKADRHGMSDSSQPEVNTVGFISRM